MMKIRHLASSFPSRVLMILFVYSSDFGQGKVKSIKITLTKYILTFWAFESPLPRTTGACPLAESCVQILNNIWFLVIFLDSTVCFGLFGIELEILWVPWRSGLLWRLLNNENSVLSKQYLLGLTSNYMVQKIAVNVSSIFLDIWIEVKRKLNNSKTDRKGHYIE